MFAAEEKLRKGERNMKKNGKNGRKLLSLVLALILALGVLPVGALAATSGTCGDNLTWSQDGGVLTISGEGYMNNYTVIPTPSSPWSFSSVNTIKIENGAYSIGSCAFGWMFSLKKVEIPQSVIYIGSDAFNNSLMITDIYYEGTEEDWNNIQIASGNYMLDRATIHYGSFSDDEADTSGTCGAHLNWSLSSDGVLTISGTGDMDDYTDSDALSPWYSLRSVITSVIIDEGVTSIGNFAFLRCIKLTNIAIPDSIARIGRWSFIGCTRLTDVAIPDGVDKIEWQAFSDCTGLTSITIPSSVTSVENAAFYQCINLKEVNFLGAESQWNAIKIGEHNEPFTSADIHYSSTGSDSGEESTYKVYYGGNGDYKEFKVSPEECINQQTVSGAYNPELAYMLISMCNSVYNSTDMAATFFSFGFEYEIPRYVREYITYSIGKTRMSDGTPLVLVVAKGTGPLPWEENPDNPGWGSNLWGYISTRGDLHSGYADAADEIYRDIKDILQGDTEDLSKVKFVMTGFSRGAAAANILAAKLNGDGVAQSHIYAYTFACPDTTRSGYSGYDCIFNINDAADFVSWTPSGSFGGPYSSWNKFGRSYWFSDQWDSMDLEMGTDAHNQAEYMEFLGKHRSDITESEYKRRDDAKAALDKAVEKRSEQFWTNIKNGGVYHQIGEVAVACPVDVKVYASDKLVGYVTGNWVDVVDADKVFISVTDDQKKFYLLSNDAYTFSMTATDEGTMSYRVGNIDVETGASIDKQVFEQVSLDLDKRFASTVVTKENAIVGVAEKNIKLYVLNENDVPEKEVLPDGKGTEIPYEPKPAAQTTFTDVPATSWYHDAVYWAVEKEITAGTGTNPPTFTPDRTCTETEILTFLWRSAGEPDSTAQLPFTPKDAWAADALTWAYEKGMISASFHESTPCTRASAAKFIWQAAGAPPAAGGTFTDVPAGADYAQAVSWAVAKGITQGTGNGAFSPDKTCTRAEIVTFLYRNRAD